ncbi:MAG: sulfide/dihydroorotate dehydrogenase-like FAD/NAD-binding protein [Clostridia bacterium]
MNKILKKTRFSEKVVEYVIEAPDVTRHAKAGQFIILRVESDSERVPFTIVNSDKETGGVTILVQTVGASTMALEKKNAGDYIADFVGPLGKATDLSAAKKVILVGGGIGTAVVAPQAKAMSESGKKADAIVGARNKELIVYEDLFKKYCDNAYFCTDDGSYGFHGFVTQKLEEVLANDSEIDTVFAVGPLPMMKAVVAVANKFGRKSVVSMNSLMVDGTGMCGCCRVTVGGVLKYACVDGPEFDGALIDFDEAMNRSKSFVEEEKQHICNLTGEVRR